MNWETLKRNSYAPYSDKPSCCVVKSSSDRLYPGVSIENVSYPLSITAEQAAIYSCLADGGKPSALCYPSEPENDPGFWLDEYQMSYRQSDRFPDGELFQPLTDRNGTLFSHLKKLSEQAVTPNSGFSVSVLLKVDDKVIEGVNVENSAWNLGLCAERVAISRALSSGIRTFNAVCLFAPESDYITPCGACRQVLSEWMAFEPIEIYQPNGNRVHYRVRDMLPYAFVSSSMDRK